MSNRFFSRKYLISHRSHKSHRGCIAQGSQLVGFAECFQPDGKRECNDAFFVRLPLAPSGGEHVS